MTIVELLDSPELLADEIRSITAARPEMVVLITEGSSDARTYSMAFRDIHVMPASEVKENGHGRAAVMHIMSMIRNEPWTKKVRGLVDRDLDIDIATERDGILYTDTADLEMYAFNDDGFYIFLEENVAVSDALGYKKVRDKIYRLCAPLGAARVAGHRESVKIPHDRFDFTRSGAKPHIQNICASDSDLLEETLGTLFRLDHTLQNKLPHLLDTASDILGKFDRSLLVSKNSFASSFIRVCKDKGLTKGNATQYTTHMLEYVARNYLKAYPQCLTCSGLYRAIQNI